MIRATSWRHGWASTPMSSARPTETGWQLMQKNNNLVDDEQCGLLLLTMDTVSSCVPRAEGEYDNFTANCPDFPAERIFRADYDGTTDKGQRSGNICFTAHPEIKKWLVTGSK